MIFQIHKDKVIAYSPPVQILSSQFNIFSMDTYKRFCPTNIFITFVKPTLY